MKKVHRFKTSEWNIFLIFFFWNFFLSFSRIPPRITQNFRNSDLFLGSFPKLLLEFLERFFQKYLSLFLQCFFTAIPPGILPGISSEIPLENFQEIPSRFQMLTQRVSRKILRFPFRCCIISISWDLSRRFFRDFFINLPGTPSETRLGNFWKSFQNLFLDVSPVINISKYSAWNYCRAFFETISMISSRVPG